MFQGMYNYFMKLFSRTDINKNSDDDSLKTDNEVSIYEYKIYDVYTKLYKFCDEDEYGGKVRSNFWKQRGFGTVFFLQNSKTKLIRIVMHQDKTKKLLLNFNVNTYQKLLNNSGCKRSFCLNVYSKDSFEIFTFKFTHADHAKEFKSIFNYSVYNNNKYLNITDIHRDSFIEESEIIINKRKYSYTMKELLQYNTYDREHNILDFQRDAILTT